MIEPLEFLTSCPFLHAVGEYLMMLPQQLESGLLGEEGSEEAGQLVADWIDRVGAAQSLVCCQLISQ